MTDTLTNDAAEPTQANDDIGWAIVELMGHRRLAGYVSEQQIAGAAMLRLDIPQEPPATQFYSPGAVYCISPTTEEIVRGLIAHGRTIAPVSRYELPEPKRDDPEPADAEQVTSWDDEDIPFDEEGD